MASTSSNSASTNEGKKLKLKLKPEKFPTYQSHLSSFGSSSTSAPHYNYKYDVFISFRGEDTRNSFAAHLHRDLIGNGIFVFKDDEELHRGKEISPGLLHAIEDSRLSIVIFSNNYATSSWCLDELVHILECSRKPGKSIIPIFYDVDPSVVRHQSGTYAPAFAELEKKHPAEKVKKWRFGLSAVANISGWHLNDRSEVELIQKIVQDVYRKLSGTEFSSDDDELVDDVDDLKYDAFLSFNTDENTVMKFANDLSKALDRKGIIFSMKDQEGRDKGKGISLETKQDIKVSKFFIIILSTNYAASSLCLDEPVHILECWRTSINRKVIPIFYNVDSSMVRYQTNSYEKAFAKHEENYKQDVERWRSALAEVGSLSDSWDLNKGREQEFIPYIVRQVTLRLNKRFKRDYQVNKLIGIGSRMRKLYSLLDTSVKDVRIVGIWGMAGIGKTTIARITFHKIHDQYEVCCFLANVREYSEKNGLVSLQEQLLRSLPMLENILINDTQHGIKQIRKHFCDKKCLLVLDDVDRFEQLDALVGETNWFGVGSRIIITTKDAHLLYSKGVDKIYKYEGLNPTEAMELLSLKAFRRKQPLYGYERMCNRILEYANGNPLALTVVVSSLANRSMEEWESSLDKMKEIPNRVMLDVLRISYDALDDELKSMFLDIACFFNGKKVDRVLDILDCCGFHSRIGMAILIDKSLVTVSNNILCLPEWVQQMGWEIVHQQCSCEPGKQSRLWHHGDINEVMTNNLGTEKIEAMVLDQPELKCNCNSKSFEGLYNLRLLNIRCNVNLPKDLDCLPKNLRFLKWKGYPLESLPSNFHPSELVELNMCHSRIDQLWEGEEVFGNLKFIKLSHSQNLIKTPNFIGIPNLETLVLEGCRNLVEVHPSIGFLEKLCLLNLKDCSSLTSLPDFISMESLEICLLSGCSSLEKIPNVIGNMRNLSQFFMDGSISRSLGNHSFNIRKWNNLECVLSNISNVTKLCLRNCDIPEGAIPSAIGCLTSLEVLDVGRNKFISLPDNISQLAKLKFLGLAHCNLLQTMPELPSNIEYVVARDCSSLVTFSNAFKVRTCTNLKLSFINCYKLKQNQDGKSLMVMLLKAYLQSLLKIQNQEVSHVSGSFDIVIPGTMVPEWFRHQNMGPSVRTQLPRKRSNNDWIGFVFCVVFDFHKNVPFLKDSHPESENYQEITCRLYTNEGPISTGFGFKISSGTLIESSHLWVCYISNGSFTERMAMWSRIEYIDASFGTSQCLEVKKCGFRVIYKQDVEETMQRKFQFIYPPSEDLDLDFFSFDT